MIWKEEGLQAQIQRSKEIMLIMFLTFTIGERIGHESPCMQ